MIKISIIGATGYVGLELVRLLSAHPEVTLEKLVSHSYVGKKYSDVYPSLKGICDIICSDLDIDEIAKSSDLVITALPHGISKDVIPPLIEKGVRVIDHSGDFRYKDIKVYEKWYSTVHQMPELTKLAVYGLPELYRDQLKTAQLVGNPGCYPTSTILGLAPALANDIIKPNSIIINATSGVSGAGRKSDAAFGFSELESNYKAYGIATHRHTSEIEQELSSLAQQPMQVTFNPHLAPFKRGILATITADLKADLSTQELNKIYENYYAKEPFLRICDSPPEVKHVAGSNFVDLAVFVDKRVNRLIILSAIDNLIKGAAGQAVQVLNIMFGIVETLGLKTPPMYL